MSSNDYVTIRIPETGWGVSWLRENPDVYCILLYDSNTGAAPHHPVLRDLISQVDQYLTAYEMDGILPPSLDPSTTSTRRAILRFYATASTRTGPATGIQSSVQWPAS